MIPDYETAARKALEIILYRQITETPVLSLPILRNFPGVRLMSFAEMADGTGMDRENLVPLFGRNQDAATFLLNADISLDDVRYVVIYNRKLPYETVRKAIARELGHIVLGHDGVTRPPEVRYAEAMCFAHHLLLPRPVIRMLQSAGVPLTLNVLADTIGCADECVEGMRTTPGVHVPRQLNAEVRDLFAPHIREYIRFHAASKKPDHSPVADIGTYMDFYEE